MRVRMNGVEIFCPPDKVNDILRVVGAICQCGQVATCYGAYEGAPAGFACDECCGHGNEDGHCYQLAEDVSI